MKADRRTPFAKNGWAKDIPVNAGVYVLWFNKTNEPNYVGETSCLRLRMSDIGRTVNHTFRKDIARARNWPLVDDRQLSHRISKEFSLSFIELHFGRAELEEYLIQRWRKYLVNKPDKRVLRGGWYDNVNGVEDWKNDAPKLYGHV